MTNTMTMTLPPSSALTSPGIGATPDRPTRPALDHPWRLPSSPQYLRALRDADQAVRRALLHPRLRPHSIAASPLHPHPIPHRPPLPFPGPSTSGTRHDHRP